MKKDLVSLPCLFPDPKAYRAVSGPERRAKKQDTGPPVTTWTLKF